MISEEVKAVAIAELLKLLGGDEVARSASIEPVEKAIHEISYDRAVKRAGYSGSVADLGWSVVFHLQGIGCISDRVYRPSRGLGRFEVPSWGLVSQARCEWVDIPLSEQTSIETLERSQRVLGAVFRILTREEESDEDLEYPLCVTRAVLTSAYNNLKKNSYYRGSGRRLYDQYVGLLFLQGFLTGMTPGDLGSAEFWCETRSVFEKQQLLSASKGGSVLPSGKELTVGVTLHAGTGSDRFVVGMYVDVHLRFDSLSQCFDPVNGEIVDNIVFDYDDDCKTISDLEARIDYEMTKFDCKYKVVWLSDSPNCQTFCRSDSRNKNKRIRDGSRIDCRYRDSDSKKPLYRPVGDPQRSKYEIALLSDTYVKKLQKTVDYFSERYGTYWMIENPTGGLRFQDYMAEWLSGHQLHRVHYCAYEWFYMKPTDIWTNVMSWTPRGASGNGLCGHSSDACKYGVWEATLSGVLRWRHRYKAGAGSHQAVSGKGRYGYKVAMPDLPHMEILGCAFDDV